MSEWNYVRNNAADSLWGAPNHCYAIKRTQEKLQAVFPLPSKVEKSKFDNLCHLHYNDTRKNITYRGDIMIHKTQTVLVGQVVAKKGAHKMGRKPLYATVRCESDEDVARVMSAYVKDLQIKYKKNPEWAKKDAHQALIDGGVLTKDGKLKDQIVTE